MRKRVILSLLGAMPVVLMARSAGPPLKRTGAAVDGGLNCSACHRSFAVNSDPRGSLRIEVSGYTPGVRQTVRVAVAHPEALRWGFQLTARLANDETRPAGDLSPSDVVRIMCDDGSANGVVGPCQASQLQFAQHFDAPRTAAGAGYTFSFDWMPPATNAGDVVFYASANAADGTNANTNDRVYTAVRRISPPCGLTAKPAITSAVNGASFGAAWNSGALMSIFGSNFGPQGLRRFLTEGDIVNQQIPQSLACIAVTINGQNAPLAYVQPNQINLQAPALAGVGPATVMVIANPGTSSEVRSDPFNLTTQQMLAPALFTFDGKSAAATLTSGVPIASPELVPGAAPAKPGDIVVLYGTGFGATNPTFAPGEIASQAASLTAPVSITVGGMAVPAADILYAGVAPLTMPGVFQFNLRLPTALPDGDLPVVLSAGGVQSAAGTTIPVRRTQ